jgi:hypothetical protein
MYVDLGVLFIHRDSTVLRHFFFHVAPPPILLYKPQIVVVKARIECETALTRSGIRRVGGELDEMAGGLGNCASLVIILVTIRREPSISLPTVQVIIIDLHPTYM